MVARRRKPHARALELSAPPRRGRRAEAREASPPGLAVRQAAVSLLRAVVERSVPIERWVADEEGLKGLDARDSALVRAIVATSLRRRGEIARILETRLDRPLAAGSDALSAILHAGAAQILFLDVPDHAAVNLAVAQAAAERSARNAGGLVNGVLRRIAREREAILAERRDPAINVPDWLYRGWAAAYGPATAAAIAAAHLSPPGLDISVLREPSLWAERLGGVLLPTGSIRLREAAPVASLPGYEEGAWWVQDAAAALPARLLGNVAGRRVADLCAAPGGKTAELAAAGARVTAVDRSTQRQRRLGQNLERLKLRAEIVAADVFAWSPAERFDAVLVDAPCSATGTIRRHPDVPYLKRPQDIPALAAMQARMLDRAAELVRPGGVLVFCTCSLEPAEGEEHVAPFLARNGGFALDPVTAAEAGGLCSAITTAGTLRTLPSLSFGEGEALTGMDGFFAARFRRA